MSKIIVKRLGYIIIFTYLYYIINRSTKTPYTMSSYSITSTWNINDLPNENGEYPYTIIKVGDKDITPTTVWAVSVNEAYSIFLQNYNS
jgi:hypothetical protein